MKIFIGICMPNMFIILWWNTSVYSIMLRLWYLKRLQGNFILLLYIRVWNMESKSLETANEYLQKLQVIQNKLLELLLNFDRRMSTNELHQQLSLLKVVDIHTVNVLSFVDECRSGRCPTLFSSYYHVREAGYELRQNDRLHVPMARTDTGQSSCKIKGARLWNNKFNLVNPHLYKKKLQKDYHETLYWNLSLNLLIL